MVFRSLVLTVAIVCGLGAATHPALPEVNRVYLLPMSGGLDQYLANQLTKVGRFEVVTDPLKADAVFTDRLGVGFEERWNELYAPPPPPAPAKPADSKEAAKQAKTPDLIDSTGAPVVRISSFARGRGNVFLVYRKTQAVIWSHYATPKDSRSKSLNDTADRIADELHKALTIKK
jgi:hypothetical protein